MPTRDDLGEVNLAGTRRVLAAGGRAAGGAARFLACAALVLAPVAVIVGREGRADAPVPVASASVPMRVDSLARGIGPDVFLDAETGRPVPAALPGGGQLRGSAWAGWREGDGRTQLAGFWSAWMEGGTVEQSLIRVSQPDGAVLDRVPLVDLPGWAGAPCWSPDRPGRVLLPGGDGMLYRVDFGGPGEPTPPPRALAWPGGEGWPRVAKLSDTVWPRGPDFGGRTVLASICPHGRSDVSDRSDIPHPDEWSIHWIRLDPGCAAVVAAGPLVGSGSAVSPGEDARFPALGTDAEGVSRLAWLERVRGRPGDPWRLRVARVDVDPNSGAPSVRAGSVRTLAEDGTRAAPAFSADGRWICYVPAAEPGGPRLRRLPLTEAGDAGALLATLASGPEGR